MSMTEAEREFLDTLLLLRTNALINYCEQIGMEAVEIEVQVEIEETGEVNVKA